MNSSQDLFKEIDTFLKKRRFAPEEVKRFFEIFEQIEAPPSNWMTLFLDYTHFALEREFGVTEKEAFSNRELMTFSAALRLGIAWERYVESRVREVGIVRKILQLFKR